MAELADVDGERTEAVTVEEQTEGGIRKAVATIMATTAGTWDLSVHVYTSQQQCAPHHVFLSPVVLVHSVGRGANLRAQSIFHPAEPSGRLHES